MVSAVVVQEINVPAMCQIVFEMSERWGNTDLVQFTPGRELSIANSVSNEEIVALTKTGALAPMYVTGAKFDANAGRSTLTVTAFDKMHYLRFGTYTKDFTKQNDEAIFEWLAKSCDLTLVPQALKIEPYPYVLQDNETKYDFLVRRCQQADYECMVDSLDGVERLIVRKSQQGENPPMVGDRRLALAYKQDVAEISLDMRVPTLGATVFAWGYDVSLGKSDMGACSTDSAIDESVGAHTGFALAQPFGPSPITQRRPDLNDRASLDFVAEAERTHHQHALIEGAATLRRCNLQAKAGVNVMLEGTGTCFDGLYYIVKSTHRFDRERDQTVLDLRRSAISWPLT